MSVKEDIDYNSESRDSGTTGNTMGDVPSEPEPMDTAAIATRLNKERGNATNTGTPTNQRDERNEEPRKMWSRSPIDNDDDSDRDRDRNRRLDRTRRTERPRTTGGGGGRRAPAERRVYVSNIPYEYKWQDLKDLFRKEVGEVSYVELFNDENNRPRGCAVIEFETAELAHKAVDTMHRYELKGRKLVVKEKADDLPLAHLAQLRMGKRMSGPSPRQDDYDRDRHSRIMKTDMRGGRDFARGTDIGTPNKIGNTYGLSTVFLESLGITGPLVNKVFVANLDYKVDEKQLKEVFKISGKVLGVDISKDQDGKSRGFAVIEYEHPVEAVQSISMLHNQTYYDRKMSVRMDRVSEKQESTSSKLPPGLKGLGMGLGVNGTALVDVSTMQGSTTPAAVANMPTVNPMATGMGNQNMGMMAMGNMGGGIDNMGGGGGMGGGMGGAMGNMGGGMGNMPGGMASMGNMNNTSMMGMGGGMGGGTNLATSTSMNNNLARIGGTLGGAGFMNASMNSAALGSAPSMGSNIGGYGSYGSSGITRDYGHSTGSSTSNYSSGNRNIIQISNLPMDYTWQSMRDLCREFGDIRFAEIRNKGTGTVRFQSETDARRAVEMLDRQRLDGRILDVMQM